MVTLRTTVLATGWPQKAALALTVGFILTLSAWGRDDVDAAPGDGPSTKRILAIFKDISQIPRCSKHEERISAWLVEWAKKRKFSVKRDDRKNVLISVPPSTGFESRPTVVLQAHMDMVCQKTDESPYDFSQDPIILVRDGD